MKKVGIVTLNGNNNYGNKLQNYALLNVINDMGLTTNTIWFYDEYSLLKTLVKKMLFFVKKYKRENAFEKFTSKYLNRHIYKSDSYDYYVVGSDQVWNYSFKYVKEHIDRYLLGFASGKKIAYAASIGLNYIDDDFKKVFTNKLNKFDSISVREESACKCLSELIQRKKIDVVLDPTMLLSAEDWKKISKKPKQIKKVENKKYILNYFLGSLSKDKRNYIDKIAKENDCEIINLLDKNSPFYTCGPSEFLYLEENAFLICTDSFHSSVFAIIFNRPFIVFEREGNTTNMNSRIDTLINIFNLKNRKYNGREITKEDLEHDYSEAYEILKKERIKSKEFLNKALK